MPTCARFSKPSPPRTHRASPQGSLKFARRWSQSGRRQQKNRRPDVPIPSFWRPTMIRQLFAVLVLVPVSLAAAQDGDGKKELGKLQGVWQVQTYEEGGANPAPDFWRTIQFAIKDNQVTFKGDDALS